MTAAADAQPLVRNQIVHVTKRPVTHSLRRLSADEIVGARAILAAAGLVSLHTHFVYIGLEEPGKSDVWAYDADPSHHVDRRVQLHPVERSAGHNHNVVVSLTDDRIVSNTAVAPIVDGQMALLDEEFAIAEQIVAGSPLWADALQRRCIDPSKVRGVPLSAGHFGFDDEVGMRVARVVGFCKYDDRDLPWPHPIDGLVAYVDLIAQTLYELIDDVDLPVPGLPRVQLTRGV